MFYRQKNGKITINSNGTMPNSKTCGCCGGGGGSGGSCFIDDCPHCSFVHNPPFFNNFVFSENTPCVNTFEVDINGKSFTVDCNYSFYRFTDEEYYVDGKMWYTPGDKNPEYPRREEYWKAYSALLKEQQSLEDALEDAELAGDPEQIELARIELEEWNLANVVIMEEKLQLYNNAKFEFNMHTIEEATDKDICHAPFHAESHFADKDGKVDVVFVVSLPGGVSEIRKSGDDCGKGDNGE